MKVTGVKTYVLENEPGVRAGGGDTTGKWYIGGKYFLILELSTDEGLIGLGLIFTIIRFIPFSKSESIYSIDSIPFSEYNSLIFTESIDLRLLFLMCD